MTDSDPFAGLDHDLPPAALEHATPAQPDTYAAPSTRRRSRNTNLH